jgi:hypothetical protein
MVSQEPVSVERDIGPVDIALNEGGGAGGRRPATSLGCRRHASQSSITGAFELAAPQPAGELLGGAKQELVVRFNPTSEALFESRVIIQTLFGSEVHRAIGERGARRGAQRAPPPLVWTSSMRAGSRRSRRLQLPRRCPHPRSQGF